MFDSVLDRGMAPKGRFGTGAVISVLAHVLILGIAFYLSTRPPAKKKEETAVTFFAAPPPPPPPPPPSSGGGPQKPKVEKKVEKKVVKKDTIVQPKEIPKEKPQEAEPEPEPAEDPGQEGGQVGGVAGGVVGGQVGGVVGGVIGGTLGGQLGGQLGGEVVPFGEGMTRPEQLEGRDPLYTREALEARVQGLMIVKCVITVEGRLEKCRVIKPLPHMERAVLESLASKRYKPVMFQGKAVAVDYVFNIRLVMPNR